MEPRFWTCHWQFRYWRPDVNSEGQPIRGSGGNRYTTRGIRGGRGDRAYIVSLSDGQLYLGGRMTVRPPATTDSELPTPTGSSGPRNRTCAVPRQA